MITYGKTGSFKDVHQRVCNITDFVGLDDSGEPIFKDNPKPTIKFTATVKLHGTNAAIGYNYETSEYWHQSRSDKVKNGHFGFVVTVPGEILQPLFAKIILQRENTQKAIVYGEWAGNGIQKGVAISQLKKRFYIFAIKADDDWLDIRDFVMDLGDDVKFITEFYSKEYEIDFNASTPVINNIKKDVDEIEKCCPVGKYFGVEGIGEGLVLVGNYNNERLVFKVKGEKHSVVTKEKPDADPVKTTQCQKFAEYAVSKARVEQALFELGVETSKKETGKVVQWVFQDVLSEEGNTLRELGLTDGDVSGYVNKATSKIFIAMCEEIHVNA